MERGREGERGRNREGDREGGREGREEGRKEGRERERGYFIDLVLSPNTICQAMSNSHSRCLPGHKTNHII